MFDKIVIICIIERREMLIKQKRKNFVDKIRPNVDTIQGGVW